MRPSFKIVMGEWPMAVLVLVMAYVLFLDAECWTSGQDMSDLRVSSTEICDFAQTF